MQIAHIHDDHGPTGPFRMGGGGVRLGTSSPRPLGGGSGAGCVLLKTTKMKIIKLQLEHNKYQLRSINL